jgi:hypothetical protein
MAVGDYKAQIRMRRNIGCIMTSHCIVMSHFLDGSPHSTAHQRPVQQSEHCRLEVSAREQSRVLALLNRLPDTYMRPLKPRFTDMSNFVWKQRVDSQVMWHANINWACVLFWKLCLDVFDTQRITSVVETWIKCHIYLTFYSSNINIFLVPKIVFMPQ